MKTALKAIGVAFVIVAIPAFGFWAVDN